MAGPSKYAVTQFIVGDIVSPQIANQPHLDLEVNIDNILAYLETNVGQFEHDPDTSSGLVFGYKGGVARLNFDTYVIADGTRSLSASATSYIEIDVINGVVTHNTTQFSKDNIPLWKVTTDSTSITSVVDRRTPYSHTNDFGTTINVDGSLTVTNTSTGGVAAFEMGANGAVITSPASTTIFMTGANGTNLDNAKILTGGNYETFYHTGNFNPAGIEVPSGMIQYFANTAPPSGWIKANGAAVSRTTYADLFAAIGTRFGSGDGSTTFNLPDLRGEFLRGWDDGRGVDSGRAFGSFQADELGSHNHKSGFVGTTEGNTDGYSGGYLKVGRSWDTTTGVHSNSFPDAGGNETRPRNRALLACIKY